MIHQRCLNCGQLVGVKELWRDMYNPEGFYAECPGCGSTFDIDWDHLKGKMFIDDVAKVTDLKELSKKNFLMSYSYLTEEEYDVTKLYLDWLRKD